jgi:glycosyltransferase involved in cell wall biosynthesis
MVNIKLSVVIPVYNVEDYIEECINSVTNQNHNDIEIIVINDGSTDESWNIVMQLSEQKQNVKCFSYENSGLSVARNRGMSHAGGEFIMFLDSDDILLENSLLTIKNELEKTKVDCLYYSAASFSTEGAVDERFNYTRHSQLQHKVFSGYDAFTEMLLLKNYISSACLYVFNHKKFSSLQFYPGIYHEDNLFTTLMLLNNNQSHFSFINENIYGRRVRENSIMSERKNIKHVDGYMKVAQELTQQLLYISDNKTKDSLKIFILHMLVSAANTLVQTNYAWSIKGLLIRFNLLRQKLKLVGFFRRLHYNLFLSLPELTPVLLKFSKR